MARPRPRPECARVILLSAWRKRSKTCGRNSGLIPGPVSEIDLRMHPFQPDLHPAPAWSELDGIGQQVPDHLLQTVEVGGHRTGQGFEQNLEANLLGRRGRSDGINGRFHDGGQVNVAQLQVELAPDDAGDIEQVVDELSLHFHVAFDGFQAALDRGRGQVFLAQHARPAEHGIERGAQLMGEGGQELVLGAVGGLGLGAGGLFARQQPGPFRLGPLPLLDLLLQQGVGAGQLEGARPDAVFQFDVGFLQRGLGALALGDLSF